jgi:hypothetical protein
VSCSFFCSASFVDCCQSFCSYFPHLTHLAVVCHSHMSSQTCTKNHLGYRTLKQSTKSSDCGIISDHMTDSRLNIQHKRTFVSGAFFSCSSLCCCCTPFLVFFPVLYTFLERTISQINPCQNQTFNFESTCHKPTTFILRRNTCLTIWSPPTFFESVYYLKICLIMLPKY